MSDEFSLSLCQGKYDYHYKAGVQTVLRNGQPWHSMDAALVGNKFVFSLAVELDEALKQLTQPVRLEPVAYMYRCKPDFRDTVWSEWKPCSKEEASDYARTSRLHDWTYEVTRRYDEAQLRQVQAERDEAREQLRFANMNIEVWRRDAEGKLEDRTAAYKEINAQQEQITLLREALLANQWVDYNDPDYGIQRFCPDCRNDKGVGLHHPECEVGKALAATDPKEQKT